MCPVDFQMLQDIGRFLLTLQNLILWYDSIAENIK